MVTAFLAAVSCNRKYEEHYDRLSISHRVINMSNVQDTVFKVWVYYSGSWNARVQEDCDWLRLKNASGNGKSIVEVEIDGAGNRLIDRTGLIHFNASGQEESLLNVRQRIKE